MLYKFQDIVLTAHCRDDNPLIAVNALKRTSRMGKKDGIDHFFQGISG
jgi:hypothetical protein